jgi:hypothetical protein
VNVRPWPHSDTCIWAPFSWSQRILRAWTWGLSGASAKQQDPHDLTWGTKGLSARPRCIGASLVPYPSSINQSISTQLIRNSVLRPALFWVIMQLNDPEVHSSQLLGGRTLKSSILIAWITLTQSEMLTSRIFTIKETKNHVHFHNIINF